MVSQLIQDAEGLWVFLPEVLVYFWPITLTGLLVVGLTIILGLKERDHPPIKAHKKYS